MNNLAGHPESDAHAGRVSDDAIQALQLRTQPFIADPADGDWFADETTREQLLEIKDALINGDDLLLVCGAEHSGKSVLLKQLAGSSGARIQCFSVRGSERFNTYNLFSGLLEAFKLTPPADMTDTLNEVMPCLQALSERNTLGVIVLDDADRVPDNELIQLLGSMQYLNGGEDSLLRVLLATEPDFEARIPELLPTESDLPYAALAIEPFDATRAEAYLEFRLNQAGHFEEFPFTDRQMQTIAGNAAGLPGGLNLAAAAEINLLYGEPAPLAPVEVASGSLLDNKLTKGLLGVAAVAMIATGLFMFLPTIVEPESGNYSVVAERAIKPVNTDRIELVQEQPSPDTIDLTATTSATEDDVTTQVQTPTGSPLFPESPDDTSPETLTVDNAAAEVAVEPVAAIAEETAPEPTPPAPASAPPAAETTTAATPDTDDTGAGLESANWVLVQNPKQYTVQLSASTDRESVTAFLTRSKLPAPNSIFSFQRGSKTWYALVHGLFPTITAAREAIDKMPDNARRNKPWIRPIGQIQQSVKNP